MIEEINLKQFKEKACESHVIDVREEDEVADGMIPNARHFALSQFPELKEKIPTDKAIIFYCRSGKRSLKAAEIVSNWTESPIYSLSGGYLAFQAEKNHKAD